jgi:hypothetical protein
MTEKSVFPNGHEPDSTKRRQREGDSLFADTGAGRHRGKALTEEERLQEQRAKGGMRKKGGPGAEGETEIADPHNERGIQHGYGKNQDEEQERMTAQGKAQGAQEGAWRPDSRK